MCIKSVIKRVLFTFSLLLLGASSFSQLEYTIERLNAETGLPTNAIKGLQFDEKTRFLWIATESGIVRYNGHNIQSFGELKEKSILNDRVGYLAKSENGTLFGKFVNTTNFTINLNDVVIGKNSLSNNSLIDFIKIKYNLNTLNYKSEIYSYNFKTFKINNNIYSLNDDLLLKFNNQKIDTIAHIKSNVESFQFGDNIFFIDENNILKEIVINDNDTIKSNKVTIKTINHFEKYFNKGKTTKVFQDLSLGDVFFIIGDKLYRINFIQNNFTFELLIKNLPYNEYYKYIQYDKITNTIYIGTDNRGVIVCRPRYFNRILPNNMMVNSSASAYAQVLLKNGNIQVNDGFVFGTSKLTSPNIFLKKSGSSTFISSKNILYYTNMDGIIEYDLNKNVIIKQTKNDFDNQNVFVENNNSIYSINNKGIIKKDSTHDWFSVLKFKWAPSTFIVHDIKVENPNELLVATTDGIYRYNISNNSFRLILRDENKANFRSIYKLDNYFLFGTYGSGIYMYKNNIFKKIPLDPNGYMKYTHCFIEDEKHNIWASSNKGLFMFAKKSFINFWDHGSQNIIFKYFGKLDGIDVLEMNGGCAPCALKLSNGDFSFPGIDGLIQFNPNYFNKIDTNNINPSIYIDKLYINNNLVSLDNFKKSLSSDIKNIDFQLGISGMLSEENVIVEYKFDLNATWKRISVKNPTIHLDKTSFGQNNLFLRFRNTDSDYWISSDFPFYVNYPKSLHPLMIVFYVIIFITIILFYIRIKTIVYQKRQKELESEVALKTKSLLNLNKYLTERNQAKEHVLAIMNHDVLTPLKYLHMTANNLESQIQDINLKKSIHQIATTSKELEYLTSNMLNWVKFDNTTNLFNSQKLNVYLLVNNLIEFITPFLVGKGIGIVNKIPKNTEILNWPDPLRILLYNIIMNSVKSTEHGNVNISIEQSKAYYCIIIEDTGIGMSKSMAKYLITGKSKDQVENLPKYKKGNGVGYQIIRNVIKLMKAELKIDSKLNEGTTITIKFKI